jgi:hypothetical protein
MAKGGFRPQQPRQQPTLPSKSRTPGGQQGGANANAGRNQSPRITPGDNKAAFGASGGFMGSLGQGLAFTGGGLLISDLFGGSALDNVTEGFSDAVGGVSDAVAGVGEGVGTAVGGLGQGVGGAVSGLGQGVGGLASGVGSGVSSLGANLPYIALAGGALVIYMMMKK